MSRRIKTSLFGWLVAGLLLCTGALHPIQGQPARGAAPETYTMVFRGDHLNKALKKLVATTEIDLMYNPSLLPDKEIFGKVRDQEPEEILATILEGTGLDYVVLSSGTYLLIVSPENPEDEAPYRGLVVDKRTGEPLVGAHIKLANNRGGASTNDNGRFSLGSMLTGDYEVIISHLGYRPMRDTIAISNRDDKVARFQLEPHPLFSQPIVVSGSNSYTPIFSEDAETVSRFRNQPGGFSGTPDAIRSLNSVMGANFSLSVADLHIQGGAQGDHRVKLDGVPVYNPMSLGRLMGAFSPYALEQITIHKAGFGADEGSQLSGIIGIKQDLANPGRSSVTAQADPLSTNARADVSLPFGNNGMLQTMVAGRTNIWQWYQKPSVMNTLERWDRLDPLLVDNILEREEVGGAFDGIDHNSDIRFYDLHVRSRLQHNEQNTTDFSFYQGRNFLQTQLLSHQPALTNDAPEFMFTNDEYNWLNTVAKLQHSWFVGATGEAHIGASVSSHRSSHRFLMSDSEGIPQSGPTVDIIADALYERAASHEERADRSDLTESTFFARLDANLNSRHDISAGLEAKVIDFDFSISNFFFRPIMTDGIQLLSSLFVQDKIELSQTSRLTLGNRFTLSANRSDLYAEPRFHYRYSDQFDAIGTVTFQVRGGLYRQFINQFDVTTIGPSAVVPSIRFWMPAEQTVALPKAYHISSDLQVAPSDRWSVRFEGYYKWQPNLLMMDYHALASGPALAPDAQPLYLVEPMSSQQEFTVNGEGYGYGAGVSITHSAPTLGMESTLSYQFMNAMQRIPNRFDGRFVSTPWNMPHQISLQSNWSLFKGFKMMARWQGIWNRSWAYSRAYYDYLTIQHDTDVISGIDFGTPSDDFLPLFHQLDISLSYAYRFSTSQMRVQLDLVNLFGRQNVLEQQIVPVASVHDSRGYTTQTQVLPGFTPSISLEYNF